MAQYLGGLLVLAIMLFVSLILESSAQACLYPYPC